MATSILDARRLREVLHYDADTGVFTWKVMLAHRRKAGTVAGNRTHGYIEIGINNHSYRAHQLAWLYVTGRWPDLYIDHKDGNRANNAFANLREVTNQQNAQNRHWVSSTKKSSNYLGVTWNKQRQCWQAQITHKNGKNVHLGLYDNEYEAHIAYLYAKRELHDDAIICQQELPQRPMPRDIRKRSSSVRGVSFEKGRNRWVAKQILNGKAKHIGYFINERDAIAAVLAARANTSPAFPPVPQQPGAGMDGIETAATSDNVPAT